MSSLDTSDYVHVSKDPSLQLSDSNGSMPIDFSNSNQDESKPAASTSTAVPTQSQDNVPKSSFVQSLVMEDSIGCVPQNLVEGTDQGFNGLSSNGQESFAIIDQSQKSAENSPNTPKLNPLLSQVIGNVGSKLVFQSNSLGTLTKEEAQNTNPSVSINESSESDVFRMSTTESNDSIIVLDNGDSQSIGQDSDRVETLNDSQPSDQDGEPSSEDFSLVSEKEIAAQADEETEKDHSLRLESFNGFESLLNTGQERKTKQPENDLNLKSPGVPPLMSGPQPSGLGQNLSSNTDYGNNDNQSANSRLVAEVTDELKSFEVPRNSLEWWPEEMKKSKVNPSPFNSYQMLPDDVGTSLVMDCSISMDDQVTDNSSGNNIVQSQSFVEVDVQGDLKSKDNIKEDIKSKRENPSAFEEASVELQSAPVSRVSNEEEGNPHTFTNGEVCFDAAEKIRQVDRELRETSSLKDQEEFEVVSPVNGSSGGHLENLEKSSINQFEEPVTENQITGLSSKLQINQEEINNDSDLFGAGSDGSDQSPDRWSFLVRKEEEKYENVKITITQTLKNYITAQGPISQNDVEDVSKMLTDVLINENALRKQIEKSQGMDAQVQPFAGLDENQNDEANAFNSVSVGIVGINGDLQGPHISQPISQPDQEVITVEDARLGADGNVAREEKNYDEVVPLNMEQSQSIPVTNTQLRLFSMLNGKSVVERKYSVMMKEKFEDKKVVLKGMIQNVNMAMKSINGNLWLGGFHVGTTKVNPVMMELLSHDSVMSFLDQELNKELGFQFCWLPISEKNYLIGYSGTEQNVQEGLGAILKLLELRSLPRPKDETNFEQKMNALKQNNDGRIVWSVLDDLVYVAWCRNLNVDVNKCLQSMGVKPKQKETEKFVEIETDTFLYLKKWKMTEIEKIASSHSVGIEDGPGSTSGFVVMGMQGNIQAAVGPILDLMKQVSSRRITIKHEAAEVFRMNDFALIKYLKRTQHCLIRVEDSGMSRHKSIHAAQRNSGDEGSYAFRVKNQVNIHIFSGDASTAEVDMLVETADKLEKTPYGDCRFLYISKLNKKAAKVIVPKWNPESGKEKHKLEDMLLDLFEDLQKYGFTTIAFPMRSFKNWPCVKLANAIIVALQTHIEKHTGNCHLKHVLLCDPESEVCAQIYQVCMDATGDQIKEVSVQNPWQAKQKLTIKLVRGEIANQKTEVIVNTTAKNLDLNTGKVSRSILRKAGTGIQDQLKNFQPKGLNPGEVAVTRGFSIDCRFVYHGALDYWPQMHAPEVEKAQCLKKLRKFVQECLKQALHAGIKSISFPALGCGNLRMPPVKVAKEMFQIFREFEEGNPNSSISEINIVIFPADELIFKAFEQEHCKYEKERAKSRGRKQGRLRGGEQDRPQGGEQTLYTRQISLPTSSVSGSGQPSRCAFSCIVSGIQLTAALGDVTKQYGYDGLVRLFTNENPFSGDSNIDPVLKNVSTRTTKPNDTVISFSKNFVTPAGDLPQKKIIHIHSSPQGLSESLLTALSTAEKEGDLKSVVIPVRSNDPLCEDYRTFVSSVYQAVTRVTKKKYYTGRIKEVKICVTDQLLLNNVLQELQTLRAEGETDTLQSLELDAGERPLILRLTMKTAEIDHVTSKIQEMESSPKDFVEHTMEGEKEIHDVSQDVYEALLYFYQKDLATNLVDMSYDGRGSKILLVGNCEKLEQAETLLRQKLQELTEKMHVDTVPLPSCDNSLLQTIVREIQTMFTNVLLFVSPDAEQVNGIHVIGMTSEDVSRARCLILEKISADFGEAVSTATITHGQRHSPIQIDFRNDVSTFITNQNIQVFVYQEDILQLPVSCIVNAANENLQHGSGVAYAILQAAGKSFETACRQHIRKNGQVQPGTCVAMEAGDLPYVLVINTVGPRWDLAKARECEDLLFSAVKSCIFKAAELKMDSIGIPAISSGIFGMPLEICTKQYVNAVLSASAEIEGSSLREIHFVDIDPEKVVNMKQTFSRVFNDSAHLIPEVSITINSSSVRPQINPDWDTVWPKYCKFSKGDEVYHEYRLNQNFTVKVYTGSIVQSAANAIACLDDKEFQHKSSCTRVIMQFGGKELEAEVDKCRQKMLQTGDVLIVDAGKKFDETVHIFFAILVENPENGQKWLEDISACTANVLQKAYQEEIYNMAMPLFGADDNTSRLPELASCLVKQIFDFVRSRPPSCKLDRIHIVNSNDESSAAVKTALDEYIKAEKTRMENGVKHMQDCKKSERIKGASMDDYEEADFSPSEDGEVYENPMKTEPPSEQKRPETESDDKNHDCVICLETLNKDHKTLQKCNHKFCTPCIDRHFQHKPVCPTCGEVYGVVCGNQPKGTMRCETIDLHLPGFTQYKTHVIHYEFPGGIQGEEHPNPGVSYRGENRTAYLPDSPKGQLALKLLKVAFDRRLVFTIGFSRTTGRDNVITWNDIHHKTNMTGGPQRFAYPDPEYLDRLLDELATKGVTKKDLE